MRLHGRTFRIYGRAFSLSDIYVIGDKSHRESNNLALLAERDLGGDLIDLSKLM